MKISGHYWIKRPIRGTQDSNLAPVNTQAIDLASMSDSFDISATAPKTGISNATISFWYHLFNRIHKARVDKPAEPQLVYNPMLLCFSNELHQTPFIKEKTIETDEIVFTRIKSTYCQARNPFNHWMTKLRRRFRKKPLISIFVGWVAMTESNLWYWIIGPLYQKLSLWALKEILEAKVCIPDRVLLDSGLMNI